MGGVVYSQSEITRSRAQIVCLFAETLFASSPQAGKLRNLVVATGFELDNQFAKYWGALEEANARGAIQIGTSGTKILIYRADNYHQVATLSVIFQGSGTLVAGITVERSSWHELEKTTPKLTPQELDEFLNFASTISTES